MSDNTMDVLVAAYRDVDSARRDFDVVAELVRSKRVAAEGVVLVEHDTDGRVTVVNTGDHLGRTGLRWGAGVGLVVGLFQPEMLGAVAVGAGAGGLAGKFVEHRLTSGLGDRVGQALPPGSAGIISVLSVRCSSAATTSPPPACSPPRYYSPPPLPSSFPIG